MGGEAGSSANAARGGLRGRVAVTGAGGQLGRQVVRAFDARGWQTLGMGHDDGDITVDTTISKMKEWRPDVIVNCAAWTDVDGCARDPERAMAINGAAAGRVAEAAAAVDAVMVQVSTNEVFDGSSSEPYREDDEPSPINAYGASKLAGERFVARSAPRHLVVRTAWIFGPGGRNFPGKILEIARRQAAAGQPLRVVADERGNPTWAPDLAEAIRIAVVAFREGRLGPGVLHVAGEPPASRFEWAETVLKEVPGVQVVPISLDQYPRPSRVPPRAVLSTERARSLGIPPSDWRPATAHYTSDLLATVS
jgi:dTDP-4-dehydrorhamnose reductase